MTARKVDNLLRGDRTPSYVNRETGAAELLISPDTRDQWVKDGRPAGRRENPPEMRRQPLASTQERIKMPRAMEITGEKERTLQSASAAGLIPGATKLFKCWTFDEVKLRQWIADKERAPCRKSLQEEDDRKARQRTRLSATGSNGRAFRSMGKSSEEVYQRAMKRLVDGAPRNGTTGR